MANITVKSLDTQLFEYWKVDDTLFFEGIVNSIYVEVDYLYL